MGPIAIGGDNPIRIQSMATTDTNDTEASVAQAKRIIDAGGELVRFTTQGTREAENMKNISARLKADGYAQPLVADVHFTAHTADVAAQYCEKVRINPGNYVDPGRTFKHLEYTDEEYAAELKKIEEKLVPFIRICKEHHTAATARSPTASCHVTATLPRASSRVAWSSCASSAANSLMMW